VIARKVLAEALGALLLTACVIGSGIMAERLAGGNAARVAGCCAGAVLANAMFELPLLHASNHVRAGVAQWLSELVATAGLIFVAFGSPTLKEAAWRVALWIGAAYWFTASTSFANPAITIGRSLSDTFAGIRPVDVPGFIAAQVVGALVGAQLLRLFAERKAVA
jgi:glycerol uptake facilitator-like aquaporin